MSVLGILLMCLLTGVVFVGIFVLGSAYSLKISHERQACERKDELRQRYYDLAGYKQPGDPKPYVPPVQRYHRRLPHLDILDRKLRNGQRGTVILRAGDRNKAG